MRRELSLQNQNDLQREKKPFDWRDLAESIKRIKIEPSALVFASFVLLLIFKLLSLLITNKTVENILIIPFQLIVFILPAYFYLQYKSGGDPDEMTRGLRLRVPGIYQVPLLISALFLILFGNVLISLVFAGTGSLEEGFTLYNTFVSRNSGGFFTAVYLIIAYAIVPAVCEEVVFRAILSREYERDNVVLGIAVSSLFFALIHFDLYMLPVYIFSGIVLALTMYATGSLVAAIAVHAVFNVFGLFGQPYLNAFYTITGGTGGLFIFVLCMMTILSAALFCAFASKSYKRRSRFSKMPERKLLPSTEETLNIISKFTLNPFAIATFVLYIVVVVIDLLL